MNFNYFGIAVFNQSCVCKNNSTHKKYQVNGVEIDVSIGNAELLVSYIIF